MIDQDNSIEIAASPESVFDFVADPDNHPDFMPSLRAVGDVRENDVGMQGTYTFSMLGAKLTGTFTDVVFERPQKRSYELAGDIRGTVTWLVEETTDGARLRCKSSLSFPGPAILDGVAEAVIGRLLEKEFEATLVNIQVMLEAVAIEA